MSRKIKHCERNKDNEEVFVEAADGFWTCPACNEKAKEIYSVCPDCGQPVRNTEEPIEEEIPEEAFQYRPIERAGNWALTLGFLGAGLALFSIITLKAGEPIIRDFGYLDGGINLVTSLASILLGSKVKVINDRQVRNFSLLILLYIFKLLSLGLGLVLVGPQPTRFFILVWALIIFAKGQKAAKTVANQNTHSIADSAGSE